jgi:asparagine synthase (glutamine-hydrolysing)
MCGILFVYGSDARALVTRGIRVIQHRGPDDTRIEHFQSASLGFARLAINGHGRDGRQPYSIDRRHCVVNGEIFNHRALSASFDLGVNSPADSAVVLPLYLKLGEEFVQQFDGFFSGLIYEERDDRLLCFRDHIGKKQLYAGRYQDHTFVCSELKAMPGCARFQPLPKGLSSVDLRTGSVELLSTIRGKRPPPDATLRSVLEAAVLKRLPPTDAPVGVFLSGGLDSSVVASVVSRHGRTVRYYTLADSQSPDFPAVLEVAQHLGVELRRVPLPHHDEVPELVERVVAATESYNPSIVSNGVGTYLLAEAAHRDGIKVVLTGDGADEVLLGYYPSYPAEDWRARRAQLIDDMHFTELRRVDACSMAHSVEVRCPFLDMEVVALTGTLTHADLFGNSMGQPLNKLALRQAFRADLPVGIATRKKVSFDVGSGLRGMIVRHLRTCFPTEVEGLRQIWRGLYPGFDPADRHFHSYPVFDVAIARRGEGHR